MSTAPQPIAPDDGDTDLRAPDGPDESADDAPEPINPAVGNPPSAADLGINVDGLPSKRALLARFAAWQIQTVDQMAALEDARTAYLEQMGVPVVTEETLRALVERDTLAHLAWIKAGASKISKADARSFEREQLETKLTGDRHQAEVARAAMDALEAEIDAARAMVSGLERRHRGYVLDALIEHADGLAAGYQRQAEATRAALLPLMGLGTIVRDRGGYRGSYASDEVKVELPTFGLDAFRDGVATGMAMIRPAGYVRPPSIVVTTAQTKAAAEPWTKLLAAWTADPMAEADGVLAVPQLGDVLTGKGVARSR